MGKDITALNLHDFANMVRMTSDGGFRTSIAKTSGKIYADASGKIHNVATSLSNAKGNAQKNLALREQLVEAFRGHNATEDFLRAVRERLGLSEDKASADAYEPLSRREVKNLLSIFSHGSYKTNSDPTIRRTSENSVLYRDLETATFKTQATGGWTVLVDKAADQRKALETESMRGEVRNSLDALLRKGGQGIPATTVQRDAWLAMVDRFDHAQLAEIKTALDADDLDAVAKLMNRGKRHVEMAKNLAAVWKQKDYLEEKMTDLLDQIGPRSKKKVDFTSTKDLEDIAYDFIRVQTRQSKEWLGLLDAHVDEDQCRQLNGLVKDMLSQNFNKLLEKRKGTLYQTYYKCGLDYEFLRVSAGGTVGINSMLEKVTIDGKKVAPSSPEEVQKFQGDITKNLVNGKFHDEMTTPWAHHDGKLTRLFSQMVNLIPESVKNRNAILYCATSLMGLQGAGSVFVVPEAWDLDFGYGSMKGNIEDGKQHLVSQSAGEPVHNDLSVKTDEQGKPTKLVLTQTYVVNASIAVIPGTGLVGTNVPFTTMKTEIEFDLTQELADGQVPDFTAHTEICEPDA